MPIQNDTRGQDYNKPYPHMQLRWRNYYRKKGNPTINIGLFWYESAETVTIIDNQRGNWTETRHKIRNTPEFWQEIRDTLGKLDHQHRLWITSQDKLKSGRNGSKNTGKTYPVDNNQLTLF